MFCTKCGSKMEEGSRFCIKCGSPLTVNPSCRPMFQSQLNTARRSVWNNKLYLWIGLGTFTMVLSVILMITIFGGSGPKKVARSFVKYAATMDEDGLKKVIEPSIIKNYFKEYDIDIVDKSIKKQMDTMLKHFKVTSKITEEEKLDKYDKEDLLDEINDHFENLLDKNHYKATDVRVYTLSVEMSAVVDDEKKSEETEVTITVMKVDGKWYVAKVDNSFIEKSFHLLY